MRKPFSLFFVAFVALSLASVACSRFINTTEPDQNNPPEVQNVDEVAAGSDEAAGDDFTQEDYEDSDNTTSLENDKNEDLALSSRIEKFTIEIPQLYNRNRNIEVYLPPDYDSSDKRYPVIYLFDGAYLFNPPKETGGDYQVDETLDRLFYEGIIDGMIAVGIELDNNHRWDEYSPWINENMRDWVKPANSAPIEGGEGFEFIDFIVETLKPEIDARYRTLPDKENTAIGGYCRTALIPLVAGLKFPDVFSMVMAMSPTVWLAEDGGEWLSNNQLINYINDIDVPQDVRFFIHVGTEESSGNRPPIKDQNGKRITYPQAYVEGAEILYQSLLNNGVPDSNLFFEVIEGSSGGRDAWASKFDVAIMWLKVLN
jgi:predicted alpha/beta superfamily hydrolase